MWDGSGVLSRTNGVALLFCVGARAGGAFGFLMLDERKSGAVVALSWFARAAPLLLCFLTLLSVTDAFGGSLQKNSTGAGADGTKIGAAAERTVCSVIALLDSLLDGAAIFRYFA